jgi:adenylate cyclase, class 2
VRDTERVYTTLAGWATPEVATYSDAYFDCGGELTGGDRELRVRRIDAGGAITTLLTYKGAAVDAGSGSKTELETSAADADALAAILIALGYAVFVAFDKHCTNYRFHRDGRDILATVVEVPQVEGTFIEVETLVSDPDDLEPALGTARGVLGELGIPPGEETRDTYTDAVVAARG